MSEHRKQSAIDKMNSLKIQLRYNSNIYMIRYYNRYINRLNKIIGGQPNE